MAAGRRIGNHEAVRVGERDAPLRLRKLPQLAGVQELAQTRRRCSEVADQPRGADDVREHPQGQVPVQVLVE